MAALAGDEGSRREHQESNEEQRVSTKGAMRSM